jgi:hypothetical protein
MIGHAIFFGPKGGPSQPEGSLPGIVFGLIVGFIGLIGVAVGRSIESASRPTSPRVAAEPAVAEAERHSDPNNRL